MLKNYLKKVNKIYGIRRYLNFEEMVLGDKYGEVVYVGKSNKDLELRLEQHKKDFTHPEKIEWLNKNDHEIFELESDLEKWQLADREQYWINFFSTQFKLNRIRAKGLVYNDGVDALKRAKERIKQMKKGY